MVDVVVAVVADVVDVEAPFEVLVDDGGAELPSSSLPHALTNASATRTMAAAPRRITASWHLATPCRVSSVRSSAPGIGLNYPSSQSSNCPSSLLEL
jgi:hypothetical protein